VSATPPWERLAIRLAAAFVLVAVSAVLVLAGLTVLSARREVNTLVERQHRTDAEAAAAAAGQAYEAAGDWDGAQLAPAGAIAVRAGATLQVSAPDGRVVGVPTDAMGPMASVGTPTTLPSGAETWRVAPARTAMAPAGASWAASQPPAAS
jgi:hypothetical protein